MIQIDKEKDLYNIWETCNVPSKWYDHSKWVNPAILKICKDKKFDECKKELSENRKKMHDSGFPEISAEAYEKAWNKINDKYFKKLEEIMKKPIFSKEFKCYITTMTRCPYDLKEHKWFMVSFFKGILEALVTCAHELMHLQFHETYWNKIEKEIGYDNTNDLKEALTVLLNVEFGDLLFAFDRGYEMHKDLRNFIEEEWKKKPDFDILIKKCVEYIKKTNATSKK